jgi:hypothetical protein
MSEWSWVVLAYSVAYVGLGLFAGSIAWRIRRVRGRIEDLG